MAVNLRHQYRRPGLSGQTFTVLDSDWYSSTSLSTKAVEGCDIHDMPFEMPTVKSELSLPKASRPHSFTINTFRSLPARHGCLCKSTASAAAQSVATEACPLCLFMCRLPLFSNYWIEISFKLVLLTNGLRASACEDFHVFRDKQSDPGTALPCSVTTTFARHSEADVVFDLGVWSQLQKAT